MTNACYECGEPVPKEAVAEFEAALEAYRRDKAIDV
jgi:hypothetical protein